MGFRRCVGRWRRHGDRHGRSRRRTRKWARGRNWRVGGWRDRWRIWKRSRGRSRCEGSRRWRWRRGRSRCGGSRKWRWRWGRSRCGSRKWRWRWRWRWDWIWWGWHRQRHRWHRGRWWRCGGHRAREMADGFGFITRWSVACRSSGCGRSGGARRRRVQRRGRRCSFDARIVRATGQVAERY